VLAPFVASIGEPLVPHLRPILDDEGQDAIWKYWIITAVVAVAPVTVADATYRFLAVPDRSP
jgi:hypothetical protein